MKKMMVLLMAASLCSACASTKTGEGSLMQRYAGSKHLSKAEEMLVNGNRKGAAKALGAAISGPSLPGVTDEALFRLALLTLKPGAEKPGAAQGRQLLKRLNKEFPESPWTRLAAPLDDLLDTAEELRRQNKSLKGANQALTKEIGELNGNIEKLKRLDLDLEKAR